MALKLKTAKSFSTDFDGFPVTGSVKIMTGVDRLNYGSQAEQARSDNRLDDLLENLDSRMLEILESCDVEIGGSVFADTPEKDRALYVGLLPIQIKQTAMGVALGLDDIDASTEKNSESGDVKP